MLVQRALPLWVWPENAITNRHLYIYYEWRYTYISKTIFLYLKSEILLFDLTWCNQDAQPKQDGYQRMVASAKWIAGTKNQSSSLSFGEKTGNAAVVCRDARACFDWSSLRTNVDWRVLLRCHKLVPLVIPVFISEWKDQQLGWWRMPCIVRITDEVGWLYEFQDNIGSMYLVIFINSGACHGRYARFYGASNIQVRFEDPGIVEDWPPPRWCNRYLGCGSANSITYRRTRVGYKNIQLLPLEQCWDILGSFVFGTPLYDSR